MASWAWSTWRRVVAHPGTGAGLVCEWNQRSTSSFCVLERGGGMWEGGQRRQHGPWGPLLRTSGAETASVDKSGCWRRFRWASPTSALPRECLEIGARARLERCSHLRDTTPECPERSAVVVHTICWPCHRSERGAGHRMQGEQEGWGLKFGRAPRPHPTPVFCRERARALAPSRAPGPCAQDFKRSPALVPTPGCARSHGPYKFMQV